MTDTPMASPQLTCDHHYISYHQGDFPAGIYWVRICELCNHIIPEIADLETALQQIQILTESLEVVEGQRDRARAAACTHEHTHDGVPGRQSHQAKG